MFQLLRGRTWKTIHHTICRFLTKTVATTLSFLCDTVISILWTYKEHRRIFCITCRTTCPAVSAQIYNSKRYTNILDNNLLHQIYHLIIVGLHCCCWFILHDYNYYLIVKVHDYGLISDLSSNVTFTLWSLEMFMYVPSEEHAAKGSFRRLELCIHIAISILPCTHLNLSKRKHMRVHCLAQEKQHINDAPMSIKIEEIIYICTMLWLYYPKCYIMDYINQCKISFIAPCMPEHNLNWKMGDGLDMATMHPPPPHTHTSRRN